jgi:hypothetical protein
MCPQVAINSLDLVGFASCSRATMTRLIRTLLADVGQDRGRDQMAMRRGQ